MAGDNNASLSALGQFYDALYELARKQSRDHGPASLPDLVPGQVSDEIAAGIISAASALSGMSPDGANLPGFAVAKVQSIFEGLGTSVGFTPSSLEQLRESFAYLQNDGVVNVNLQAEVKPPALTLSADTVKGAMLDPNGLANSIADKYWNAKVNQRVLEFINALGGEEPSVQLGTAYLLSRAAGVDADLATAVVTSKEVEWKKASPVAISPDKEKGYFEQRSANADAAKYEGALSTAVAAYAGMTNPVERTEFADYYNNTLKDKVLEEYNRLVAGTGEPPVYEFEKLFKSKSLSDLAKTPGGMSAAGLFAPGATGVYIQQAFSQAISAELLNTGNSTTVAHGLQQMFSQVNAPNKFASFIGGMYEAKIDKGGSLKGIVKLGLDELQGTFGAGRGLNFAKQTLDNPNTFLFDRRGAVNQLGYLYQRWNTMPTLNKIFTPVGLFTGSSWLDLANWTGAVTFNKFSNPGLFPVYQLFQGNDKINDLATANFGKRSFKKAEGAVMAMQLKLEKNLRDSKFAANSVIANQLAKERAKIESKLNHLTDRFNVVKAEFGIFGGNKWGYKPVAVLSHKAGYLSKMSYTLYAFSPGAFFGGLLNGDTFQRLAWIGTGFGKHINNRDGWLLMGRVSHFMLNNRIYRGIANVSRTVAYVVNLPKELLNVVVARVSVAAQRLGKLVVEKTVVALAKKVLGKTLYATLSAALAYITAGVSKVLQWAYNITNFVTFGTLDKITGAMLRILMQVIIGLGMGLLALSMMGLQSFHELGGPSYITQNLGSGGLFAPDPGYSPVYDAYDEPFGAPIDPGDTVLPPIDWEDYDEFSDNLCPIQIASSGASVTYCSQGPNGKASHHGRMCGSRPCNYAIDMAPGDVATQVVAPTDGKVEKSGIRCTSTGETVLGVSFTSDSGVRYQFYHVIVRPELDGKNVSKGTVIGAMIIGRSACSTGSHVHMEVWRGMILDSRPDAAYAVMCGLGNWSCNK